MMMICTWKLHKSSLDHVTWAPKLGSPVATATAMSHKHERYESEWSKCGSDES